MGENKEIGENKEGRVEMGRVVTHLSDDSHHRKGKPRYH